MLDVELALGSVVVLELLLVDWAKAASPKIMTNSVTKNRILFIGGLSGSKRLVGEIPLIAGPFAAIESSCRLREGASVGCYNDGLASCLECNLHLLANV